MFCSTQMIRNSDIICSSAAHGTSKTAEWIVTQSKIYKLTSTNGYCLIMVSLWKASKEHILNWRQQKVNGFLGNKTCFTQIIKHSKVQFPEALCLINSSGDATSNAMSILKPSFAGKPESYAGKKLHFKSEYPRLYIICKS